MERVVGSVIMEKAGVAIVANRYHSQPEDRIAHREQYAFMILE